MGRRSIKIGAILFELLAYNDEDHDLSEKVQTDAVRNNRLMWSLDYESNIYNGRKNGLLNKKSSSVISWLCKTNHLYYLVLKLECLCKHDKYDYKCFYEPPQAKKGKKIALFQPFSD